MISAFFISDLHLKTMEERNSQKLLRFLVFLASENVTHLFLVGDIFDLWIGHHSYFVERFRPIVDQIEVLVKKGVHVHFFEGNHDLYLKHFWHDKIGVQVHADAEIFQLAKLRVRIEHGDLINPNDRGYLFLRWFLRTAIMKWVAYHLPERAVAWIGSRASRASRRYTSTQKFVHDQEIIKMIHAHTAQVLLNVGDSENKPAIHSGSFDVLISGHVHVRHDQQLEVGGRKVRTINLGSWFDEQKVLKFAAEQNGEGEWTWLDLPE